MNNTLIVVLGPTGIGKSAISIQLAKHLHCDIISADSRQIFKELAIGTAVPSPEELSQVRHHLIQHKSISDFYSASQFETEVGQLLPALFSKNHCAILTGGSMLYLDAVCKGIDDIPDVDHDLREQLIAVYKEKGIEHLRLQLKTLDPEYYAIVDLKNPKRLLHALEICLMTGRTYTSFRTNTKKERPYQIIKIGLNQDREKLYARINQRVDKMIAEGLVDEVRSVYPQKHLNSLNTVGYKEIFLYLDGKCTLDEAIDRIKCNSRKYARKQLTWFRRDLEINWFEPDQIDDIIRFIDQKLAEND